jgi:hypothetical protein
LRQEAGVADASDEFALEEYRALRATIRERGTARLIVTAITFIGWAGVLILGWTLLASAALPALVPLVLLAAGFEAVFAAHVAAERVGRYLLVQFEADGRLAPRWEHAVLAFSGRPATVAIDPLNAVIFLCAAGVNLLPLLMRAAHADGVFSPGEVMAALVVVVAHGFFVIRVRRALHFSRRQRAHDTEIFRQLG